MSSHSSRHANADNIRLRLLVEKFSIHRLAKQSLPPEIQNSKFSWVAQTDEELSVVCESKIDLVTEKTDPGWRCLKVLGPLDFSMTGVIAGLSKVLAEAEISIFALSTFDTDYLLLQGANLERALSALSAAGYDVQVK